MTRLNTSPSPQKRQAKLLPLLRRQLMGLASVGLGMSVMFHGIEYRTAIFDLGFGGKSVVMPLFVHFHTIRTADLLRSILDVTEKPTA